VTASSIPRHAIQVVRYRGQRTVARQEQPSLDAPGQTDLPVDHNAKYVTKRAENSQTWTARRGPGCRPTSSQRDQIDQAAQGATVLLDHAPPLFAGLRPATGILQPGDDLVREAGR